MARTWLWRALGWSIGVLALEMIVVWFGPESAGYVFNVVAMACFLSFSDYTGLGRSQLGLDPIAAKRGLPLGIGLSLATVSFVMLAAAFNSDDFEQAPSPGSLAEVLFEIARVLFITAMIEELIFRGVLFAAWRRAFPLSGRGIRRILRRVAPSIGTGVFFGLWHIGPTRDTLAEACDPVVWGAFVRPVLFTMLIGTFVLGLLRERTQSVANPVLVHFAFNASAITVAYALQA